MNQRELSLIDIFGYFFSSYYSIPKFSNKEGFPTGLLLGFANLINQIYLNSSTHLIFALEGSGEKKRKEIYSDYKANREEAPSDLLAQIPVAIGWIKKMGLASIEIDGYEADDAIASIINLLSLDSGDSPLNFTIVSSDKDFYQLLGPPNISIYDPLKKKMKDEHECLKKYEVSPDKFLDFQALVGDSSDNISGIKGIGQKTASKLLNAFNSLDEMYERLSELEAFVSKRIFNLLLEGKDAAYTSRNLAFLRRNLISNFDLTSALKPPSNPLFMIKDELDKYEINILSRIKSRAPVFIPPSLSSSISSLNQLDIPQSSNLTPPPLFVPIVTLKELKSALNSLSNVVAFDTESDSLDTKSAKIIGFSFSSSLEQSFYVPLAHTNIDSEVSMDDAREAIKYIFSKSIVGHNLKFDLALISTNFKLDKSTNFIDTMILAWLQNPSRKLSLDSLSYELFLYSPLSFKEILNFIDADLNTVTKYAAEDAYCTLRLYLYFKEHLSEQLWKLARDLEFPLIKVLIEIEQRGIQIDLDFFNNLKVEILENIKFKEEEIIGIYGSSFNVASNVQLSNVLFNELKLPKTRQLKSGIFSTDEFSLDSLDHPIIPPLLDFRELSKLHNTYINPLINKSINGRIYTSLLQTGTTTGRLSSKNPNLQNIPVRTNLGRRIREGFIAKEGYLLISCDYSQIELRMLAHFSLEPSLCEAFNNHQDIHLRSAEKIFGNLEYHDVNKARQIAKGINFGLLYGMGARKLARNLKISAQEAKKYIDAYFKSFPSLKSFLETKQMEIEELGFSETILGRRRYFDFHNARTNERLEYQREAINTIFQGSAADIIKMAMNKIHLSIPKARMILQVHDELLFEVKEEEVEELKVKIIDVMENIYPLHVPLVANIKSAKKWSDL